MTVVVRNASKEDISRLIEMFQGPDLKTSEGESRWFINCYFDYHHIVVAEVDGRIEGACVWRIEGERYNGLGWIENVWVEEEHRRTGIAEKLIRSTIDDMKGFYESHGIRLRKVVLTTQTDRAGARALYEKVGFKLEAELDELYDPGGRDLVYVMDLGRLR